MRAWSGSGMSSVDGLQCEPSNTRTPAHISARRQAGTPVTADASFSTESAIFRSTKCFEHRKSCTTAASLLVPPVSQ
jgi:hypothetical protein